MIVRRFAGGSLLALLVASCGSSDEQIRADAGVRDAGGASDSCSEGDPCRLVNGSRSTEYLFPVGDTDAFEFDVPAAGRVVNILVENDTNISPVRLEVVFFGPNGAALENRRFQGIGRQRVEIQWPVEDAGRHRVVVRDVGNDAADRTNPFFITVTVFEETDPNEPNDVIAQSTPITPGTPVSGTIGFDRDVDWFSVTAPANRLIEVQMVAPGTRAVRFVWELWSPTGDVRIARSREPEADVPWPVEVRAVQNQPGAYLIAVRDDPDDGDHADLTRVYELTVRLIEEPDPQDRARPNDTATTASALTPGVPANGYIASSSDFDYYAVQVAAAPQLIRARATMSGPSAVDLSMSVLAPDGETLICDARDGDLCRGFRFLVDGSGQTADLETAHLAIEPGTYYVRVRDQQDDDFDLMSAYTVQVDLPTEPDVHEDYNQAGRDGATIVAASSTAGTTLQYPWVEGYLSHANDTDWYRFDFPGPPDLAAEQNGDWLVEMELQIGGPTPVELQAFLFGSVGSPRESYRGYGQQCREPSPSDPFPCQFPDADNAINETFGEQFGDCFVVFREVTGFGPHYLRITDLDRDDFDLAHPYRLRLTLTAGCPNGSTCSGVFLDESRNDLCGRP